MIELNTLYHADYPAWTQRNAELFRSGCYTELDIEHLIAELTDIGKSKRDELENCLVILLAHLLKWQYQYQTLSERWRKFKRDSWCATIIVQRERIQKRLKKSPSLKSQFTAIFAEAYADATQLASTHLALTTFPSTYSYSPT